MINTVFKVGANIEIPDSPEQLRHGQVSITLPETLPALERKDYYHSKEVIGYPEGYPSAFAGEIYRL